MSKPVNRLPAIAVILAAGAGTRSGLEYPKQFLRLGGLTVLEHTLQVFESEPSIDEVVVVGAEDWLDQTRDVVWGSGAEKVSAVVPGGATRNGSTRAAINYVTEHLAGGDCKLLLHDAVRPLLDKGVLRSCVEALDEHIALDVVIETADTIVRVDGGFVTAIPNRALLRRGQTPQGFRLSILRRAYDLMSPDRLEGFTDDCAVVKAALPDVPIVALTGSEENLKITRPVDIYLADRLLQGRQVTVEPDGGEDLNLGGCVVVIGGTSGIGKGIARLLTARGVPAETTSRSEGVDVRDHDALAYALNSARERLGPVAGVVNTAGVLATGPFLSSDVSTSEEQIEVNLKGALNVARAAHSHLRETSGHLLLFTSSSYTRGRAGYATYSASKAGVVNVAQALAEEWQADHVKVNCINPARTDTPMRRRAFGEEPPGSLLSVDAVAAASVAVLARETTGHVFDVRL